MKEKGRSRALRRKPYGLCKRFLSAVIAVIMIATNIGTDLTTAYAAESSDSIVFEMSGSVLVSAIEEAIDSGNPLQEGDIDFTNGKTESFEELFFGNGTVYEIYPEYDGGGMDAELRVFVRLPEDAGDMYMVTGDEEIIFLYVNNGEETIRCSTSILRMEDGKEKVKRTKKISVKSYEAAYGDEEVDIISKPAETAPEETDPNPSQNGETSSDAGNPSETVAPTVEETKDTEAAEDMEGTGEDGDSEPSDGAGATKPSDESETKEPSGDNGTAEPSGNIPQDTQEPSEEPVRQDDETAEEDAEPVGGQAEDASAENDQDSAGVSAAVSRHHVPMVSQKPDDSTSGHPDDVQDSDVKLEEDAETESSESDETEETSFQESSEESASSQATETEDATTAEGSSEDAASDPTASAPSDPTAEAPADPTASVPADPTAEAPADPTASAPADPTSDPASTTSQDMITDETPAISIETEPSQTAEETAADDEPKVNAATTNDLVGIGYCSTAKAYTTTVNTLKALDDFEGYKVSYAIYSQGTARIVDGPRGVEEGGTLTFGVKTQVGYDIQTVSANGEELALAETDDTAETIDTVKDVTWFTVEDVTDEQEIEVYTTETGEHPEFSDTIVLDDGMIISLYAPEGVLPKGVTATAERVAPALEDSIKENAQEAANGEGKNVASVAAYDINLWLGSDKLDAGIWNQEGAVVVTFSGMPVEEASQTAEEMSVIHVEADAGNVQTLEEVSDRVDVSGGRSVDSLSFEAEHFSIYAVVSKEDITKETVTLNEGETFLVKANWRINGTWSSSDENIVSVRSAGDKWEDGRKYSVANVKALQGGREANISYGNALRTDYFKVVTKQNASRFYFKYNNDSSNISLWYSVNGGALVQMDKGEVLDTAKTDIVSFYVKPAAGYVTPTKFEHRNGPTEDQMVRAAFGEGIYENMSDAPSTITIDGASQDFSAANGEAASMGCTNQFHYSFRGEEFRHREFKIKATPAKVKVRYEANGAQGKAPADHNTYAHPVIGNGNSYIEIKGPGNLNKDHFSFAGWELMESSVNQAGKKVYEQGDKLFVGDVWKDVNTSPVTYVLAAKWNPEQYGLTTAADRNSTIDQGFSYTYDAEKALRVNFAAAQGYRISGIEVDGVGLTGDALGEAIANGWVEVDCKRNHHVAVTSVKAVYQLITSAENAAITKGASYSYSDGDSLDVKFKADRGYGITSITVDGRSYTRDEIQSVLSHVDAWGYSHITLDRKQDHIVVVKADKTLYTLTAKADENSWINPESMSYEYKILGLYKVAFGANDGYEIQNIIVDGKELSDFEKSAALIAGCYLFDYKSSHTIEVTTRIKSYHLTTDSDRNSWITPSMDFTYDGSEKLKVEFGADEGYYLSEIWVDLRQYQGDELKAAVEKGYVELERSSDHSVFVKSKINRYKLTVGADENSRITEPKTAVTPFEYDAEKCLIVKFKANPGYRVSSVVVDNVSLEGAELLKALAYDSVSVDRKGNHSVYVEASPLEYTLTTGSGLYSRITYPQDRLHRYQYDANEMIEVTFEAQPGYRIFDVYVDSHPLKGRELQEAIEKGRVKIDRKGNHTVFVTAKAQLFTLTTNADEHSSISGGVSYGYNEILPVRVEFKAHKGYAISSITVDGQALSGREFEKAAALGSVSLSRTQSHEVAVTSRLRQDLVYTVNYFFEDERGIFRMDRQYEHARHVANAEYGADILFDRTASLDRGGRHYALDHIEGEGKKVSLNPWDNVVNVYYGVDEIGQANPGDEGRPTHPDGTPDRYQVTFTYRAGANGAMTGTLMEVVTRRDSGGELSLYAPVSPTAGGVGYLADQGFTFHNWRSDQPGYKTLIPQYQFDGTNQIASYRFRCDTVFTAHFLDNENITYKVEFYMQSQGRYPYKPTVTETRNDAPLHELARVTDQDLADKVESECTYILDTGKRNITEAEVKDDGSTTLKLYFKQQFTVIYKPGDDGNFAQQAKQDYKYNDRLNLFIGEKTPKDSAKRFAGWRDMDGKILQDSQLPKRVTRNMIYTAVFEEDTVKAGFFVRRDKISRPEGNVSDPTYNYALMGEGFLHADPVMVPAPSGELNDSNEAVVQRIAQWPANDTFIMDKKTYSKDDVIWYRIQFESGDSYEWHVDGELKHNITVAFDLNGGTMNGSTDPSVTYKLQRYGVITDNLIPSMDGNRFGGWKVLESNDSRFEKDGIYQAADVNNHEFTGNVAFEADWDINKYTVDVVMVDRENPANVLDTQKLAGVPFGADPAADGSLNGLIPDDIDGTDGNHYIYTGMMSKSYEAALGVRENGRILLYYMVDNDGPGHKPDGIPDAYEIQFTYESSNEQQGRVKDDAAGTYGTVTEWKSLVELDQDGHMRIGSDGKPVFLEGGVSPDAAVTAEAQPGYSLSKWNVTANGVRTEISDLAEARGQTYQQDTVFTAQWSPVGAPAPDDGGPGGSGGSGGGSGGSGGSGSGSGRRYVSTSGGPGAVTLEDAPVPMADAPEMERTVIDDGEIPLAPLPKTGNVMDRMSLTFLLSGIVLTLSVYDRRRHVK